MMFSLNVYQGTTNVKRTLPPPPGGTPHMKGVRMLVGNFELNPKGDRSGRSPSFILTPKRDHVKTQTIYIYIFISFHVQP